MRNLSGFLFTVAMTVVPVSFAAMDVNEIVNRANLASFYAAKDGRTEARMVIQDSQGRKQLRQFVILRRDKADGGDQDMLVFFSRPSDVRGTVFRVAKQPQNDDDRWLYLPGLDLVKRIAAGDKRTSFVGSHYFYEDVSGRNPALDSYSLVEETEGLFRLRAEPKDPASVEFASYRVDIDKQSFLPIFVEYFDANDKVIRRMVVEEQSEVDGHPVALKSRIEDLRSGGTTMLEFKFISFDLGLPESIFSERSLRKPPRNYLARPKD